MAEGGAGGNVDGAQRYKFRNILQFSSKEVTIKQGGLATPKIDTQLTQRLGFFAMMSVSSKKTTTLSTKFKSRRKRYDI